MGFERNYEKQVNDIWNKVFRKIFGPTKKETVHGESKQTMNWMN